MCVGCYQCALPFTSRVTERESRAPPSALPLTLYPISSNLSLTFDTYPIPYPLPHVPPLSHIHTHTHTHMRAILLRPGVHGGLPPPFLVRRGGGEVRGCVGSCEVHLLLLLPRRPSIHRTYSSILYTVYTVYCIYCIMYTVYQLYSSLTRTLTLTLNVVTHEPITGLTDT